MPKEYGTGYYGQYVYGGPINTLPSAPTNFTISKSAIVAGDPLTLSWNHNDADGDPQAKSQARVRSTNQTEQYPTSIKSYNPILYYRMNDPSGSTVAKADSGLSGTYSAEALPGTASSPMPGEVCPSNGYATFPAWTKPNTMTFTCWFRADANDLDTTTTYRSLYGFGGNDWDARFDTPSHITFHNYSTDGGWGGWGLDSPSPMNDGIWHMVAFVWDGPNLAWSSYLDGVLRNSGSLTGPDPRQHTTDYHVGASSGRVWTGDFAEFAVVPVALSAAQISGLYGSISNVTRADWTVLPEQTGTAQTMTIDTSSFSAGTEEVQVRTADYAGYGEWTGSLAFSVAVAGNANAVPGKLTASSVASIITAASTVPSKTAILLAYGKFPSITAQNTLAPSPGVEIAAAPLAKIGGAATVHAENNTTYSPTLFKNGGTVTLYWNGLFAVPAGFALDAVEPERTVYIMPPEHVYTELEYRAKFTEGFTRITRRVEILNSDGTTLWDDKVGNKSRLISGSVSVDYTRDERRSLDLELANFDKALVHQPGGFWYDKTIKCYRGIEFYDESGVQNYEVQLGVFMIDRVDEARFPRTVKVTARDYTKKALLSKLTQATMFTASTKMTDVVAALASNAGIHDRIFPNDSSTLGVDYTFDRGTTRWEAMKQIATAFSYELFFNASGYLVMREMLDPTLSPISHEFLTGPMVGNLVDWSKSSNDTRIFNHVSVIGSDTTSLPVWADAYNNNPLSPTNIATLGDRTQTYESGLVTTTAQAQALADSMLAIASLEEYEINMSSLVYPWLEAGEIVRFIDPDKIGNEPDRFLLTALTIPMGLEPMSATGRRVLIVS